MGRFYYTQDFEGKFAVACQPSNDPITVFGMEIDEENGQDSAYYAYYSFVDLCMKSNSRNQAKVKGIITRYYDLLNIPLQIRKYQFANQDELDDYISSDELQKYVYKVANEEEENDRSRSHFYLGKDSEGKAITGVEVIENANLYFSRIYLGLVIYSQLKLSDCCTMTVDL